MSVCGKSPPQKKFPHAIIVRHSHLQVQLFCPLPNFNYGHEKVNDCLTGAKLQKISKIGHLSDESSKSAKNENKLTSSDMIMSIIQQTSMPVSYTILLVLFSLTIRSTHNEKSQRVVTFSPLVTAL